MIIIEDFAPFELAVKLKEKGFDCSCIGHYVNNQLYIAHYLNAFHSDKDESLDAPTISQVLKWLFDEKQLFVNIDCNICDKFGLFFTIYKKGEETWEACGFDDNYYNKPEEATLAGIEYVLNNLI